MFISKHGEVTKISSFQEFADFMYQHNAFALSIPDIVDDFDYLTEAIDAVDKVKVICNKDGVANMLRIKFGTSTRWMVNSSIWLKPEEFKEVQDSFLEELECFFRTWGQEFV